LEIIITEDQFSDGAVEDDFISGFSCDLEGKGRLSHSDLDEAIVIRSEFLGVIRVGERILVGDFPFAGVVEISDSDNQMRRGHEEIGEIEVLSDLIGLVGPIILRTLVLEGSGIITVSVVSGGVDNTVNTLRLDSCNKEEKQGAKEI
jgi:hypothetical protein